MQIQKLKKNILSHTLANDLFIFSEVSSTNDVLNDMFENENISDGAIVISDCQIKGRGRHNRKWVSPSGLNLYMSVLFKPDIQTSKFPIFTFLASCALMDTFVKFKIYSKIKWPNDILVNEKKIAGVLTEFKFSKKHNVNYLIVGIGVNLNLSKRDIYEQMNDIYHKVTSMSIELDEKVEREIFTAMLINNLDKLYNKFKKGGHLAILNGWAKRWGSLGKEIRLSVENKIYKGVVEKVDENGFLHLRKDDGKIVKIISGDVIF